MAQTFFFFVKKSYPIALLMGPLVGAIAGGNSIILKPSENCPATSNLLSTLVAKYLDPNNICVVNGGPEQSTTLLDCRFDHIFFTGGTSIGKMIALKAAETLTTTTLELGELLRKTKPVASKEYFRFLFKNASWVLSRWEVSSRSAGRC
jgi:hypothetical protein